MVQLLTALADEIWEKLNEQSSQHDETSEELESATTSAQLVDGPPTEPRSNSGVRAPSNRQSSVVKLTTVNFLTQLLECADFVPIEITITILSDCINRATHIDSHVAMTEAILHMFDQACEVPDGFRLLDSSVFWRR